MKRMAVIFGVFMLLFGLGCTGNAQATGTSLNLPVQVLDKPAGWQEEVILRITAPNGQDLYLISLMENPVVYSQDVNFDGVEDLAVMVVSGVSNAAFRLFVLLDGRYVPVNDGTEQGLFNPVFHGTKGLVESYITNGHAGALHERALLRWEGSQLRPVRRAVCEELRESDFSGETYREVTWNNILHTRVYDYTTNGEPTVLHEEQIAMEPFDMDAYQAFFSREQDALWKGL